MSCEPNHRDSIITKNLYTFSKTSNSDVTASSLSQYYERYAMGLFWKSSYSFITIGESGADALKDKLIAYLT